MSGKIIHAYFSAARVALIREVRYHPQLVLELAHANIPATEWTDQLAYIAGYCNIILDGAYTPEDLDKLADKLYWKLIARRKCIITPMPPIK